jgi:hypothetical protein
MWHKARAQSSQGVAGRPCVGAFPETVLSTCVGEVVLKESNAQKAVQGGNMATRPSCMADWPDKWAPHAQSLATAPPYSYYKYHGASPDRNFEESEV